MNKTQGFRVELQVSGGGVTGKGRYSDNTGTRQEQDRGQDRDKMGTRYCFRGIKKFSGGGGGWVVSM